MTGFNADFTPIRLTPVLVTARQQKRRKFGSAAKMRCKFLCSHAGQRNVYASYVMPFKFTFATVIFL